MEIRNLCGEIIYRCKGKLLGACLMDLDLRQAVFSGLILEGAHFEDSNLEGADFTNADLYWASFFQANLSHAILRNTNLRGTVLECAILRNACLDGADLGIDNVGGSTCVNGADFTGVDLRHANLRGAVYNQNTVFPDGFVPAQAGMIIAEEDEKKYMAREKE